MKQRVHNGSATRIGEYLASQSDQSSCRHVEIQPDTARSVIDHLDHLSLAAAELLDHDAEETLRAVDHQQLQRLRQFPIHLPREDFGLPDHQLVTLTTHRLDEDCQLKLTPPHNAKCFRATRLLYPDGYIGEQFLFQPVA